MQVTAFGLILLKKVTMLLIYTSLGLHVCYILLLYLLHSSLNVIIQNYNYDIELKCDVDTFKCKAAHIVPNVSLGLFAS